MVDSFAMSMCKKRSAKALLADKVEMLKKWSSQMKSFGQGHGHALEKITSNDGKDDKESQLFIHNRFIAQVLELGIIVHSVVIGLAMGGSDNRCTIQSPIAALCFQQMLRGNGIGGMYITDDPTLYSLSNTNFL